MIVPFIIGALALGKAFNIFDLSSSPFYMFDGKDIDRNLQINFTSETESRYKVISNSADVIEFLHLSPYLALKAKQGSMKIPGVYAFLSRYVDRNNTIEILFYVYHEAQTQSFPAYTKQVTEWQRRSQSDVGTHYIQGIKYGGELLVSYQISPSKSEFFNDIKDAVETHIGSSGAIDSTLVDKLDKLNEAIQGKAFTSLQFTSSGTRIVNPRSVQEAVRLAVNFPSEVEKFGSGKGGLLRLNVEDLHTLNSDYKPHVKNYALIPVIVDAYSKFDDLVVARRNYEKFENDHMKTTRWTKQQRKMLNEYYGKLVKAEWPMTKAIVNLDPTGSSNQFVEAFSAYGDGANKFQIELQKLIKTLLNNKQF